ncbi:MAG: hypothetical protein DRI57_26515 [Deltaproteobacteria bacterium]|nr:MAG: hypothetical protein DRI57_26515 [Deltaproteobacteria bacterium]
MIEIDADRQVDRAGRGDLYPPAACRINHQYKPRVITPGCLMQPFQGRGFANPPGDSYKTARFGPCCSVRVGKPEPP